MSIVKKGFSEAFNNICFVLSKDMKKFSDKYYGFDNMLFVTEYTSLIGIYLDFGLVSGIYAKISNYLVTLVNDYSGEDISADNLTP